MLSGILAGVSSLALAKQASAAIELIDDRKAKEKGFDIIYEARDVDLPQAQRDGFVQVHSATHTQGAQVPWFSWCIRDSEPGLSCRLAPASLRPRSALPSPRTALTRSCSSSSTRSTGTCVFLITPCQHQKLTHTGGRCLSCYACSWTVDCCHVKAWMVGGLVVPSRLGSA